MPAITSPSSRPYIHFSAYILETGYLIIDSVNLEKSTNSCFALEVCGMLLKSCNLSFNLQIPMILEFHSYMSIAHQLPIGF